MKTIFGAASLEISASCATIPSLPQFHAEFGKEGEEGGTRGYCGHLSSSASRRPDTRQRTLLNQLKLCRPRGVADLSSRYESGKDGASARARGIDEGEMGEGWRKFNSRRNEG